VTGTPSEGPAPSSGVREGTVDGARQASPLRRNLLLACLAAVVGAALVWGGALRDAADLAAVQGALAHWEEALVAIGFLDPAAPKKLRPRLNQLLNRARLTDEEVHILRGIARAVTAGRARR